MRPAFAFLCFAAVTGCGSGGSGLGQGVGYYPDLSVAAADAMSSAVLDLSVAPLDFAAPVDLTTPDNPADDMAGITGCRGLLLCIQACKGMAACDMARRM